MELIAKIKINKKVGKDMKTDIEKYVNSKLEEFEKELDKKREEFKQDLKEEIAWMSRPKSIWDLKSVDGDRYYYISLEGGIGEGVFNTIRDSWIRSKGDAFLTREEAEFELERRKVEAVMRKYSSPYVEDEENYCILYLHDEKRVDIGYYSVTDYGIPHFKTEEIAQKVIDEIGRDRLKKHWFGVE